MTIVPKLEEENIGIIATMPFLEAPGLKSCHTLTPLVPCVIKACTLVSNKKKGTSTLLSFSSSRELQLRLSRWQGAHMRPNLDVILFAIMLILRSIGSYLECKAIRGNKR
jgi:hypothetical protein